MHPTLQSLPGMPLEAMPLSLIERHAHWARRRAAHRHNKHVLRAARRRARRNAAYKTFISFAVAITLVAMTELLRVTT